MAQAKKVDSGKKSNSWIMYVVFLILLGAFSYGSFQYGKMKSTGVMSPDEKVDLVDENGDEQVVVEEEIEENPIEIEDPVTISQPKKNVRRVKRVSRKSNSKGGFVIRVASCFFDNCKNNFINELKKAGFASTEKNLNSKVAYFELVTKDIMKYDDAKTVVDQINKGNRMTGSASLKNMKSGFQITMGIFPEQKYAEKLHAHISSLSTTFNVNFVVKKVDRVFSKTVVMAGPFPNKLKAENALSVLKKRKLFKDAFITTP